MSEDAFNITDAMCGISLPCLVRKVTRARDWPAYSSEDSEVDRLKIALDEVFSESKVSLYRVETARDIISVAIGLNSGRSSLHQSVRFLGVDLEELKQVGARIVICDGETACDHANSLHVDVIFDKNSMRESLVKSLLKAKRQTKQFSKSKMKKAVVIAQDWCCRALSSPGSTCECSDW